MRLSVIVPALDEADTIERTLADLSALPIRGDEIIVVDGGSSDATIARALPYADRVIDAPRGRARQMNAGADAAGGHFVPIGSNGFYEQHGQRARFDQQPVEAQATASACLEAYRSTGDTRWRTEAGCAFDWFLGRNDLALPLYDPTTGGCRDGLHPDRANENQGAESTLAFLQTLLELRLAENPLPALESQP